MLGENNLYYIYNAHYYSFFLAFCPIVTLPSSGDFAFFMRRVYVSIHIFMYISKT